MESELKDVKAKNDVDALRATVAAKKKELVKLEER